MSEGNKLIISSLAVFLSAALLPGVEVTDYIAALWVAIALSLLNGFLKPILIVLTIPVTLFSLGLFLLVINAAIILMADYFVDGFWDYCSCRNLKHWIADLTRIELEEYLDCPQKFHVVL